MKLNSKEIKGIMGIFFRYKSELEKMKLENRPTEQKPLNPPYDR